MANDSPVDQERCAERILEAVDCISSYGNHMHVYESDHDFQMAFGVLSKDCEGNTSFTVHARLIISKSFTPEIIDQLTEALNNSRPVQLVSKEIH